MVHKPPQSAWQLSELSLPSKQNKTQQTKTSKDNIVTQLYQRHNIVKISLASSQISYKSKRIPWNTYIQTYFFFIRKHGLTDSHPELFIRVLSLTHTNLILSMPLISPEPPFTIRKGLEITIVYQFPISSILFSLPLPSIMKKKQSRKTFPLRNNLSPFSPARPRSPQVKSLRRGIYKYICTWGNVCATDKKTKRQRLFLPFYINFKDFGSPLRPLSKPIPVTTEKTKAWVGIIIKFASKFVKSLLLLVTSILTKAKTIHLNAVFVTFRSFGSFLTDVSLSLYAPKRNKKEEKMVSKALINQIADFWSRGPSVLHNFTQPTSFCLKHAASTMIPNKTRKIPLWIPCHSRGNNSRDLIFI